MVLRTAPKCLIVLGLQTAYYFARFRILNAECSPHEYIVYYDGSHILGAGVTGNSSQAIRRCVIDVLEKRKKEN